MKEKINTKTNNEYKPTELGPLPQEWQVVRLGEVAEISSGGSAPQGEHYFRGDKPFIRVSHIDNEDSTIKCYDLITNEAVKDYKLKLFPKGTIVFPKSGATVYLEKRAMLPIDAYIVSHLCAVISKDKKSNQNFLFHVLKSKKLADKKADGYPTLNLSEVKEILIPLPPLSEQKKIAEVLSTVQKAIEIESKLIERTKELKKSTMHKLFTEGTKGEKQKMTEISPIPESWEVESVSSTLIPIRFPRSYQILSSEIKPSGKYPVIDQGQLFIAGYSDYSEKVISEHLPLVIFGDHTRVVKYVDFPFIIGADGTKILKPKPDYNTKFFYYALLFIDIPSRGYNRHFSILKEKIIPKPPLSEQQAIADILSTIDQKIEFHTNKKQKLEELFRTLLHELMTAKISVNDVNLDFIKIEE